MHKSNWLWKSCKDQQQWDLHLRMQERNPQNEQAKISKQNVVYPYKNSGLRVFSQ